MLAIKNEIGSSVFDIHGGPKSKPLPNYQKL